MVEYKITKGGYMIFLCTYVFVGLLTSLYLMCFTNTKTTTIKRNHKRETLSQEVEYGSLTPKYLVLTIVAWPLLLHRIPMLTKYYIENKRRHNEKANHDRNSTSTK